MNVVEALEQEELRNDLPNFAIGDTVDVVTRVAEGEKDRTQVFSGTVIARKGRGIRETFTVRRIVQGEGVERVFPLQAPSIVSIKITRRGKVRRSKLYYLRDRVGKATKVKESRTRIEEPGKEVSTAAEPSPETPEENLEDEAPQGAAEEPAVQETPEDTPGKPAGTDAGGKGSTEETP